MSRFERLSWYWSMTNRWLAERVERRLRLEDLLEDYDSLDRALLSPAGLRIDRATWQREVRRPRNTSTVYRLKQQAKQLVLRKDLASKRAPLAHWSEWTADQTERFWEIAGETMRELGYAAEGELPAGGGRCASLPSR